MSVLSSPGRLAVGDMGICLRERVHRHDAAVVRRITDSSGFFSTAEVEVAAELVQTRLARGAASGYFFLFADADPPVGQTVGYSCFGPIACTQDSFDLYWIAVLDRCRGIGLGNLLIAQTERLIQGMGGGRIYVETSSRGQYAPTRHFYTGRGYSQQACIPDFYAPGDGKIIYVKELLK